MSNSKHLPPFTFDVLCYLSRDQLERFSIVCRCMKNLIDRYFYSKPYRVFDYLDILEGSYALFHNRVRWHPNRDDYSVQQFLDGQKCSIDGSEWHRFTYYSFSEMQPYLGPTVRIKTICILIAEDSTYSPEHIEQMESIAYLWRDGHICVILLDKYDDIRIVAEDFQLILNSPTILQCQKLSINNANFSFKDYKVLYTVKVIDSYYYAEEENDPSYWTEFLEQPGVKPVVVLKYTRHQNIESVLDRLSKAFSSAVVPNAFKIVFYYVDEPLTEFRETNKTSGEKLELKKGLPTNCESIVFDNDYSYTLERSSV